jgi:hypothetical protein
MVLCVTEVPEMAEKFDQTKATKVPAPEVKETHDDTYNRHASDHEGYDPCITRDDPYGNTVDN